MQKKEFYSIAKEAWLSTSQVEVLLCHILNISRENLFTLSDIKASYLYPFQKYLLEYTSWKPDAYILWKQIFFGREFFVEPCTLIPRPETECLVEVMRDVALKYADMQQSIYLDIGTGTWCVGLSLIWELEPLKFQYAYLSDISQEIWNLVDKNIQKFKKHNIEFILWSLLEPYFFRDFSWCRHLYITANLPYIKENDTKNMWVNVQKYEPYSALYGGKETGFEMYETLLKQCFQLKKIHDISRIDLCIEIGFDQREISQKVLESLWLQFEYFRDMTKIERVIHIFAF